MCKFGDVSDSQYVLVQDNVVGLATSAIAHAGEMATQPLNKVSAIVYGQSVESVSK
jgi:hypothetical protein